MKIGLLTYHRIVNDGSIMQAYCLYSLLMTMFPGHTIEIVDYRSPKIEWREYKKSLSHRPPFVLFEQRAKTTMLRSFLKNNCKISSSFCLTDNLYKDRDYISRQSYDAVVVGSDTVWEVRRNGGAPLAPNIYYFPNVSGTKKISFAVSADQTEVEFIQNRERRHALADMVKDFDFISVRDNTTYNFLKYLGINEERILYLPDPTLLWDFSSIIKQPEEVSYSNSVVD